MDAVATLRERRPSTETPAQGEAPKEVPVTVKGEGAEGETFEHLGNFLQCVREGAPDKVNCGIANGVGSSLIGLMIRQSIEQKHPVSVEETLADTRKPPVPAA